MALVKRIAAYLKPVWFRFLIALIGMACVAGVNLAHVWLLKFLIDQALTNKDMAALQTGIFLIVLSFGLKSILWYSHTYLAAFCSQTAIRQLRDDVYRHLYSLSMGFFNQQASAGILARLTNDMSVLQGALLSAPTVICRDGLTVVALIGYLFYTNWRFSLLCFLILPLSAWVLTKLGQKSRRAGREGQALMGGLYSTIQEALTAMPIVKVFQAEEREIQDFEKENKNYFNVSMRLVRVDARSSPIMEFIGALFLGIILAIGGHYVLNNSWSLGGLVSFIGAAVSLYNPIKKFASVNGQLQLGLAAGERVFELLDQRGTVVNAPDAKTLPLLSHSIRYENVSFSYPTSEKHVLRNVNLEIKKGEVVALVGASGSGKSTIAQLLLRFYDPTEGRITVDGQDIRFVTLESLRENMAVVTQETHLFNDTVRANIAYGRPTASLEDVESAARAAYAHEFIQSLPKGYDTLIGERGTRLSGGERQRLAIARSLLKNPAILVLDEATSALDTVSEQAVQRALDRLLEGRTVLMIAHRLSTVRKAHRIVVLDSGGIKEMGRHEELIQQKGAYHRLYEMQALV